MARWPRLIPAGSVSDEFICLTDMMATWSAIVDSEIPEHAGEDSVNILPALRGESVERPLYDAVALTRP